MKKLFVLASTLAMVTAASAAEARVNVDIGLYAPAPVYVVPARPVYYTPRPVYYGYYNPIYYADGRYRHRQYDWNYWNHNDRHDNDRRDWDRGRGHDRHR